MEQAFERDCVDAWLLAEPDCCVEVSKDAAGLRKLLLMLARLHDGTQHARFVFGNESGRV
jgi:hypothetical protein